MPYFSMPKGTKHVDGQSQELQMLLVHEYLITVIHIFVRQRRGLMYGMRFATRWSKVFHSYPQEQLRGVESEHGTYPSTHGH